MWDLLQIFQHVHFLNSAMVGKTLCGELCPDLLGHMLP